MRHALLGGLRQKRKLTYADSLTPQARGKPDGVMHLQVYLAVGRELASHPDPLASGAASQRLVTRTPFSIHHNSAHNDLVATYIGRWSTRTGFTGMVQFRGDDGLVCAEAESLPA